MPLKWLTFERIHLTHVGCLTHFHSACIDDIESAHLVVESLNKKGALTTEAAAIELEQQINLLLIYQQLFKSFWSYRWIRH